MARAHSDSGGDYFDIDGSVMEGGGQILRMSAGLAALFSRPIRIYKIRAGRAKPGLKGQHLSGLQLMTDLTGGQLDGAALGSSEIRFRPGELQAGHYSADTKTAGAVCLLAQISVPAVIFSPGPVSLALEGGTNTDMAPQIDEYTEILLPNIKRFGVSFEYEVVRKGFFPSGGGKVNFFLNPLKKLRPISMTDPGKVSSITGWSFCAGNLPVKLAEQMTAAAKRHLLNSGCDDIKGVDIDVQTYKEDPDCSPRNGSGIVLVARTSTGCVLGGSAVGSNKVPAEKTGRDAAECLLESIECGGCVDRFIQDQMIIFMALAEGESRLVTGPLTLHTETAIHIATVMTGATFRIESCQNNRAWLIICQGVGYENKFLVRAATAKATMSSVKERQLDALKQMLSLETSGTRGNNNCEPSWKVLVYDKTGQDILGPLLSVKELRDLGVTLHLLLHSSRDSIPDAPAVYFCLPTDENIQRMCQDINSQLYGGYYYNFISPINRDKLEILATAALQSGSDHLIQRIYDQYTNFICLEPEMFCLKQTRDNSISYYSLNKGSVQDTEMENMLNTITESLFSVCVTLGTVPIIRCPSGNAAEAVASKLDKKLRDNLKDTRNSLFNDATAGGRYSFHRPVLVLVDRAVDLATPLHHTWTYQALAHDVLPYNQNRVTLTGTNKVYELDSKDKFWMEHKGSPFPQVAEAIEESLKEIKGKEDEIKSMKRELGLEGGEVEENIISNLNLSDNTNKLTNAVSSLPELLDKKRLIDMHCSLATTILDVIKQRRLDVFFELEEKIMSGTTLDKSILDILTDPETGISDDKLRLFLIYYLLSPAVSDGEIEELSSALTAAGAGLSSLTYLRRCRQLSNFGNNRLEQSHTGAGQGGSIKAVSMFSSLISQSSNFVMAGVKNLVVKKHNLPLTKIVDEIMEQKQGKHNEEYKYLDPKILRGQDGAQIPRTKTAFNDAIVFVVGGGNYIEYQNLQDYVKNKNAGFGSSALSAASQKRIVYGSTQLMNADQFLGQLTLLGQE